MTSFEAMLFFIEHAAALMLVLVVAAATGTAISGSRFPIALRSAIGLAFTGQIFVMLASIGLFRPWSIAAFVIAILIAGTIRFERVAVQWKTIGIAALFFAPLFVLALYPPLAFDETRYHLPFITSLAKSGRIEFLGRLCFPVFPQLHELLAVPLFQLLGDQATHLMSLAELIILVALIYESHHKLAAALVLGSPIVVQMATITHTDSALMLFVGAAFVCLERESKEHTFAAAFLLGSACSVKYLGWYFVVIVLLARPDRLRFLAGVAAGVLPMYAKIIALTGNPVFPFFGKSPWSAKYTSDLDFARAVRIPWDLLFARERLNWQPPFTPLIVLAAAIVFVAAFRNRRLAFYAFVVIGYVAVFTVLPQDSRYLMPLIPIVSIAVAPLFSPSVLLALVIALPAPAYAIVRIVLLGPVRDRVAVLERQIPEYRALERRSGGRIYAAGTGMERLRHYGGDDFLGEIVGPDDQTTVVGTSRNSAELAGKLKGLGVRELLVSRRIRIPAPPEFELIYRDEAVDLWRLH